MRFIYKLLFISFFILSSVLSFIYLPLIRLESIEIKHNHFIPLTEFDDLVEQYESRYSSIFTWIILQYKLRSFSTKIDSYNVIFKDYKSLVVEIFEKKPWLSFLSEGRSIIVAIDGTILTHGLVDIDLYGFDDLIIIRGIERNHFGSNSISESLFHKVSILLNSISAYLGDEVFQIEFQGMAIMEDGLLKEQIILFKDDTLPIYIGSVLNLKSKFNKLEYFIRLMKQQKLTVGYIDLRVANQLIVGYDS